MKHKTESLDAMKIIEEILEKSKKASEDPNYSKTVDKKLEFLETLKKNAMSNFLENIKNKTISEVKNEFSKRIEEYNHSTQIHIDKKNKEK